MEVKEILHLLKDEPWQSLRLRAEKILLDGLGKHVYVRGLVEFSNICKRNCLYCGLRAQNKTIERYRLSQEEIMASAAAAAACGVDTIVLQSGEGACKAEWLAEVIAQIRRELGLAVTVSVGERPKKDYELWAKAGAERYLIKHETADPGLYAKLHPGHKLEERINSLKTLRDLGYAIGSGFMIGLPGQSLESIARDIALLNDLHIDMCGAGPFIAQKDTPLANCASGSPELALRVLAALRIALPWANLPATTALATLDPQAGQINGLRAGANVLMPSFTPPQYAKNYVIYDNKNRVPAQKAAQAIEKAGREHQLKV